MTELAEDIETIAAVGGYEDVDAVVDEAVRELLRRRPQLWLSLAIGKYRQGAVSLNRGAELAGVSTERFKDELAERGVPREAGVLDPDERAERLEEFSG